jgi:hypothetical protein
VAERPTPLDFRNAYFADVAAHPAAHTAGPSKRGLWRWAIAKDDTRAIGTYTRDIGTKAQLLALFPADLEKNVGGRPSMTPDPLVKPVKIIGKGTREDPWRVVGVLELDGGHY